MLAFFDVLSVYDKYVEDILYHHAGSVSNKIRIIKIDEKTMNELGDFSEWDRSVYAELVDTLTVSDEIKPAVIGFDVLFSDTDTDAADKTFAESCEKHGAVVCAFSYVFSKELVTDENGELIEDTLHVQAKVEPYPELKAATSQGFANALMDKDDGVIRASFLHFDENGIRRPSLSAAVYEKYCEVTGAEPIYPTDNSMFAFRFSGGVSDYENVSMCDVLDGTIPPQAFDGCIVLVGAYAAGMMDAYYVPVDRGQQMYGVEIHGNVIQAIMEGRTLEAVPPVVNGIVNAVLVLALMLVCERLSAVKIVIVTVAAVAVELVAGIFIFNMGHSGNILTFPICAVLTAVGFIILHYYMANSAKRQIEKAFSKYVAPQVVKEIAKSGSYELKLGGENRDIAVLFVDIRGFTPLSESLQPEQVVDILNTYLEHTSSCVFKHGGTLDKFIGDATMAVFNSPFDTEDYEFKAVQTALDIARGGERLEKKLLERYGKSVGFGVGVNCGPAVVGNIGCDFRMDYTAIGDTVNTAARLEANAPKGKVYISGELYERLKGRLITEEVGEISLKGKSKGVFVYSVTDIVSEKSEEIK
ncbi:MAG: adenylate/guanylate cyclase domain-containing protein [Oscillospiraceae bacterium]|nr:adenylate/guanylate cyclase domain-containing protein [Oscillospiraceae bacterium]